MSSRLNIALSPKLKSQSSKLYKDMGMSLSTAVKIFLQQSVTDHQMPFRPSLNPIPNEATKEALNEAKHSNRYKTYTNEDSMWKDILK